MPTEVSTLCFHTRDVVAREDSSLTFEMPRNRLRTAAAKVALASCEFPMVQWTLENDWNRLWLNEGIRLTPETQTLRIATRLPDNRGESSTTIKLPLYLNPIRSTTRRSGGALIVQTTYPHGFRCGGSTTAFLSPALVDGSGDVLLVGSTSGDISLTEALTDGHFRCIDDTTFELRNTPVGDDAAHLLVPTIPSPKHLCDWITAAAQGTLEEAATTLRVFYDASCDRVLFKANTDVPGTLVRILPDPLAIALGVGTKAVRLETTAITTWPCATTALWDYVSLPPGFYAPCHRPMCVGQPLRLGTEMESAVNRLYFPLVASVDKLPQGTTSPHLLVFSDPDGRTLTSSIPCGRYTPEQLCAHLEADMTRVALVLTPGISFSVTHENDYFVFACERRGSRTGRVAPVNFGLLFHHPLSIDPARLGFSTQPLSGSHTYVAPTQTRTARAGGLTQRSVSNILRVSEITPQKRFRFHGTHPPPMIGVIVKSETRTVLLKTHINKLPFAHGYQPGDVVRISVLGPAEVLASNDKGELSITKIPETSSTVPDECSCVVQETDVTDPCVLCLQVPRGMLGDVDTCVQIASEAQPWNMCFCKPNSLPETLIGFPKKAILWGLDGSVLQSVADSSFLQPRALPPYEAPNVYCLDHPDYVLITFSESSGASLEHSYDGEHRQIFCKLSLYPLFREERSLPRDTTLLRDNLSRFTLAFWNPDMRTPYRFHGSEFSFSLNFVSVIPDA